MITSSFQCAGEIETYTPQQQGVILRLSEMADTLVQHLHRHHPNDAEARAVLSIWPIHTKNRLRISPDPHTSYYDRRIGCVFIPLEPNPSPDWNILRTRLLLALAGAAGGGGEGQQREDADDSVATDQKCSSIFSYLLNMATDMLDWKVAMNCTICLDHGLCSRSSCPKCRWRDDPRACFMHRRIWAELVGKPVQEAMRAIQTQEPTKKVALATPETMMGSSQRDDSTIIMYIDVQTGTVSTPPPHLGGWTPPSPLAPSDHMAPSQCFLPGLGGVCFGAPMQGSPWEWHRLIGLPKNEVVALLRAMHPQAVVVDMPHTAPIAPTRRTDRIRVVYDPDTMQVDRVPLVG